MSTKGPVAVVLTALPLEFDAVVERLENVEEIPSAKGGPIFEVGNYTAGSVVWRVAVAEIGAGNHGAAVETTRALQAWNPDVAAFVGVAGGVKDVKLGDVVIAGKVYAYESGKETADGLRTRPSVHVTNAELVHVARAVARNHRRKTRETTEAPKHEIIVGAIAAGEKVIADVKAESALLIARGYGDTLAVEMEGAGFMRAAHECSVRAVVIRGVSDLLSGKAEADSAGGQPTAANRAADAWFEMLARLAPRAPQHELEDANVQASPIPKEAKTPVQDRDQSNTAPTGVGENLVPILLSEMHANGKHNLLFAKKIEADRNFVIEVAVVDDGNRATLRRLSKNARGKVGLTYGVSAFLCEVVSANSVTVAGHESWRVELREFQNYASDQLETSLQRKDRVLGPDDFALLRARRLLLNENPHREDEGGGGSVTADDLNAMMYELHVRGNSYPISILQSPLPKLYELLGANPEQFITFARLLLAHQTRLSGVCEDIERLSLTLVEGGVSVDFRGVRGARYANLASFVVEVKGVCSLAAID